MKANENKKNFKKLSKNFKILIAGLVLLFIVLLLVLGTRQKQVSKKGLYTFDNNKLITINENGLYGFINQKGKVVTKPEYNYVVDTSGKYAVVEKGNTYYLIDQNGKVKQESKTVISYDQENDLYVSNATLYNSNLNAISPNKLKVVNNGHGFYKFTSEKGNTVGIINSKGRVVYKQEIEDGHAFYNYIGDTDPLLKETYCVISDNNMYFALINCNTGKVIKKYSEATISAAGNNIFYVETSDKTISSIFVHNNKVALESKEGKELIYYSSGYVQYQKDGKTMYYNIKTKKSQKEMPMDIFFQEKISEWEYETGYKKISCTKNYGIIDEKNVIVPCIYDKLVTLPYRLYDYLENQGKKYVIAVENEKTYILDMNKNKPVHEFDTKVTLSVQQTSPFINYTDEKGKTVVYNINTNKEKSFDADSIDTFGNYFRIHKDNKITYYNLKLEKIYETEK
ncbi:MAG: WG repeat-containing protein [Bacilli bacterium]|nr:WG repeat-containing protein [Bacilli bacterium]